jgi:tight adherence protein B
MGFLLALCFAAGVGMLWFGLLYDVRLPDTTGRLSVLLAAAGVRLDARVFIAGCAGMGAFAGLIVSTLVGVPVLGVAAGIAGAWAPLSWARSRRERTLHERERAWPAVLSQLADSLEAGLAFPAAVALAARSGPEALREELAAFHTRLRTAGVAAALDGLATAEERTADTVVLLLRAGLVDLPAGGLAPVLRELSDVLSARFEAREKARSRAHSLQVEAAILALSPIVLLLLVGVASPTYLDAYKTPAGTVVGILGGLLIFGCYVLMRRLGRVPEPRRTGEEVGR